MAAILAQRVLHKSVNLHMHVCVYVCVYVSVRAQMHPYTISKHCLITASLLHENLLANSPHTLFGGCEKLVGGTKKPELVPNTSSTHAQNRGANFRNQLKRKIQSGVLDSRGGIGLLCADKQHGLMVRDPAWTTISKYTVGSSTSKIQYVSTQRATTPNDLYTVGLVWLWTKPSL